MPFAELNGISMHYETEGQGTPIVLVAGFCANTGFFRQLIPDLARDHKVVFFDNRGAGTTVFDGDTIHPQDFVDDILALFDHLHMEKAHLLGWSLGAHMSQEFALQHPDRLLSLTLISAYPYRPARSSYFMNGIVDCALEGGDPSYISMMTNSFCFTEEFFQRQEAKGHKLNRIPGLSAKGLKGQMNALDEFDTRDTVQNIRVPTLSIHGLDDIMVEPSCGDYISDRIPGCEVMRIAGQGHIIKPSLYSERLRGFIASHERA